jgi:proteasome activator subunit 4
LAIIAHLEPDLIIPGVLKRFYPSMQGLLEAHRTTTSLASLSVLMPTIARHRIYRNHATTLLGLALPGIDPNDLAKTTLSLTFMISTCMHIPLWDLSDEGDHTALASAWITSQMETFETMHGDDYPAPLEGEESLDPTVTMSDEQTDLIARSSTGSLGEWITSFFNQIFGFLSNMPDSHKHSKTAEEVMIPMITLAVSTVLQALEPKLFTLALKKMQRFVTENVYHNAGEATASIVRAFIELRPEESLAAFIGPVVTSMKEEIRENGAGKSGRITTTEVLPSDRTLLWYLKIFNVLAGPRTGEALVKYVSGPEAPVREVIEIMARECKGTMYHYVPRALLNVCSSLATIYPLANPLIRKQRSPHRFPQSSDINW